MLSTKGTMVKILPQPWRSWNIKASSGGKVCNQLGAHINLHIKEERNFHCYKCPISLYKSHHLTRHMKAKHTKNMWSVFVMN